jgi:hypothetical protein
MLIHTSPPVVRNGGEAERTSPLEVQRNRSTNVERKSVRDSGQEQCVSGSVGQPNNVKDTNGGVIPETAAMRESSPPRTPQTLRGNRANTTSHFGSSIPPTPWAAFVVKERSRYFSCKPCRF